MSFLLSFIYRQFLHSPPEPTASFKDQTVIITGSSSGLGLAAAQKILQLGASRVILACRSLSKAEKAKLLIEKETSCLPSAVEIMHLNMSSYASVLSFAEEVKRLDRLDAFLANAGVQTRQFRKTEGNEESITTNVVATALLACLIHPKLEETAKKFGTNTHFTVTSSELHEVAKLKEGMMGNGRIFETLSDEGKSDMGDRYNVSKLLIMAVVRQVAEMRDVGESGAIVNCVAPGLCASELHREQNIHASSFKEFAYNLVARKPEIGARTLVYGASAGVETHGKYLPDCVVTEMRGLLKGEEGRKLQEKVWKELKEVLESVKPGVTGLLKKDEGRS